MKPFKPHFARAALLASLAACIAAPAFARRKAEPWGTSVAVGFHYPGVSARYAFRHAAVEGLYLMQDKAAAFGPRLYYLFNPGSRAVFNAGAEYAWINGKTDIQDYTGSAVTGFLGVELFSARRISVGMDMGLCRVSLDGERERRADETSLVANIALHFYL